MKQRYNKLVRDNIPKHLNKKEIHYTAHTASEDEYKTKLKAKLIEEVHEFIESENPQELADILEVIYAIGKEQAIQPEQLEMMRQEKAQKKGTFTKRIILDEIEEEK